MSKLGKDLLRSAKEARAIARGEAEPSSYRVHIPPAIDVRAIRKRLRLSQEAFALRYGFSVGAVRDWEQGRSTPTEHARAYLIVIERNPKAVEKALGSG